LNFWQVQDKILFRVFYILLGGIFLNILIFKTIGMYCIFLELITKFNIVEINLSRVERRSLGLRLGLSLRLRLGLSLRLRLGLGLHLGLDLRLSLGLGLRLGLG
jgi:hypothetical protein